MLRAKRRRASKYNTKGKQIFSTLNTTVKYEQQLNVQNGEIKTDRSITTIKPTNTVYTDNYARNKPGQNGTGCSFVVEGSGCVYDLSSCIQYKQYNPTVQNKHGYINDAYNYSTKQYFCN